MAPAQLDAEREGFTRCARSGDFTEAVAAFLEKRPAPIPIKDLDD